MPHRRAIVTVAASLLTMAPFAVAAPVATGRATLTPTAANIDTTNVGMGTKPAVGTTVPEAGDQVAPPHITWTIPQTAPPPTLTNGEGVQVPQTVISPSGKKLTLKFNDEFDAVTDKDGQSYIDRTKWQTTFWQGSSQRTLWGNIEAEYYTDKDYAGDWKIMPEKNGVLNPFSFENDKPGVLTINATKVPQELWKKYYMGEQRCFSSGLLISDKRFNFQYGYIEGRFKLPANKGAWPAFWLLGNDPTRMGDDPKKPNYAAAHEWGPEVDIFEFFGHRPTKHSAGLILHKGEKTKWKFGFNEVGLDISQQYHTWGLEWNADDMILTFDGKVWAQTNTPDSFKRPMYLLVNLAVGGQWYSQEMSQAKTPAKPWEVDEGSMPWKMDCDYVRVYQ